MLSQIRLRNLPEDTTSFPWSLPLVSNFEPLSLQAPVTFFVGENGSGKSTILEAIAAAAQLPSAGSNDIENDPSLEAARSLGNKLALSWSMKMHHGFFARSEDFIGFARKIKNDIEALNQEMEEIKESLDGRGNLKLALGPMIGEKQSIIDRYTADLEAMSHGEGFLQLFKARFTAKGLYLIDEPEAALSPQRQLSLISLILNKVKTEGCQFLIATHSPMIMAIPDAQILLFKDAKITPTTWKETSHYQITKQYLDSPEAFLKHL